MTAEELFDNAIQSSSVQMKDLLTLEQQVGAVAPDNLKVAQTCRRDILEIADFLHIIYSNPKNLALLKQMTVPQNDYHATKSKPNYELEDFSINF